MKNVAEMSEAQVLKAANQLDWLRRRDSDHVARSRARGGESPENAWLRANADALEARASTIRKRIDDPENWYANAG